MKINPCGISNIGLYKNVPSFSSNPAEKSNSEQINELSGTTSEFNVRVPIKYTKTGEINLGDGLNAQCYKLANGQRVVIVPKEGSTVVKTYVNTGSFNEPDNLRGISHYIEHNLFNGSEDLGDSVFFDEVNKMGAYTNASTSFANTNYYIHSTLLDDTDLEKKIKLHAGMLTTPKFLTDKLEKEKLIVNSEINMCLSEDENIGFTKTVKNLFNIKSTSKDLVAGSTDNISALTRDDVVEYFNNNYYPANMTTVITGDVDPEQTIGLVAKYFNQTKAPSNQRNFEKMTPTETPIREDIISEKSESGATTIFLGFASVENNNAKEAIHLRALRNLASGLYNSRFSDLEREYGVGISISNERLSSRPDGRSMLLFETRVPEDNSEKLIKDIYEVINSLAQKPVSDEELQAIKNDLKKGYDLTLEESESLNHLIGNYFMNDRASDLEKYNETIDNMTAQDIQNLAKKYLDLNKAVLTVVHPKGTTKDSIEQNYKLISDKNVKNVSFTGSLEKTPINIDNIKTYRTHNNYEVVLNNAPTNTIQFRMFLEKKDWTPKKAAIVEVLSDMLKNAGTKSASVQDLAKEADIYGITYSIFAGGYGMYILADFPVDSTDKALDIFKDRILNPNLNEKEFENSVRRQKDIYRRAEVNPFDKLDQVIHKNTPYQFSSKDILEGLDTITLKDIKDYYNEILTTCQGKFAATGPFENNPELKDKIFNMANQYPQVKKWNKEISRIFFPIEKTEVLTDTTLKNQADIVQCFKFKNYGNIKDTLSTDLLNIIFGGSSSSRLFSDLRETRHLAYHVSSSVDYLGDMGLYTLVIGTTTENKETGEKTFDNVQKSINGFNENIERIKNEKVSEEELEAAKRKLKSQILMSLETNREKNNTIAVDSGTLYGADFVNKAYKLIDSITAEDIQNTAQYIFNSKPIYSITGTKDTIDANKEFFKSLEG